MQAVANILSAFSSSGFRDEPLFSHLALAVKILQDQAMPRQPASSVGKAAGTDGVRQRYVQSVQTFGAQALSIIVQVKFRTTMLADGL